MRELGCFLLATATVVSCAAASGEEAATVVLALSHEPSGVAALERRLQEVSDPSHAEYGAWLSSEEVTALVGATHQTVRAAEAWLQQQCGGLELLSSTLTGQRDFLEAVVVGAEEPCLRELLRTAERDASGILDGAFLRLPRSQRRNRRGGTSMGAKAASPDAATELGSPNAQKQAYGIPQDTSASHADNIQLVWGPGTFGYLPSDLEEFYSTYNVSANVNTISTFGFNGTVGGDNFYEATLDVTYITSMGLDGTTLVANTNDSSTTEETTGFGYALLAFSELLASSGSSDSALPLPAVVSMSLGSLSYDSCALLCSTLVDESDLYTQEDCDEYMATQRQVCMYSSASIVDRINVEFLKSAARGVTLLGATGDGGSHFSFGAFGQATAIGRALNDISCRYQLPTFPAESPYVLGVGGEQWSGGGSSDAPVYWYAGGAGFSRRFHVPAYQASVVADYLSRAPLPPSSSFNPNQRAYPDVVALASNVPMVADGSTLVTGGTSASAPAFAGIVSLLNKMRLDAGLPVLGFLQPRLYSAAAEAEPGAMFYDIVVGNSSCGGDHYDCGNGFVATEGWDAVTGWGSPRWEGLVEALAVAP